MNAVDESVGSGCIPRCLIPYACVRVGEYVFDTPNASPKFILGLPFAVSILAGTRFGYLVAAPAKYCREPQISKTKSAGKRGQKICSGSYESAGAHYN